MTDEQKQEDGQLHRSKPTLWNRLRRRVARSAKRYLRSFSFVGWVFSALFFAASVSPSLLPRPYIVQGILSGFSLALGYGVGVILVLVWKFCELPDLSDRTRRVVSWIIVVVVAIIFVSFLWRMAFWQNSIRELMGMEPVETGYPYRIGTIAIVCAVILVFLGRSFAASTGYASRKLNRFFPRRIANTAGFFLVGFLALSLANKVVARSLLNAADRAFSRIDSLTEEGIEQPSEDMRCGSKESLVAWDTIGRRGKDFLVGGPTKEDIQGFSGTTAKSPLRIFVGLRSDEDAKSRSELALQEMIRCGAFDRKLLIVATPTGTGWLDPNAVDTIEYMHRGDTAIVSVQYSYLPSWITILVDPNRSRETAHALFDTVYAYWTKLPKESRPKLYLQGLSLGAMGAETSADLYTIFGDPIQGAVFSGTPFPSVQWREFIRSRNEGTPVWLPKFRDGSMVRFMNQWASFDPQQEWGPMRSVYIQYASDPMVWFSPTLAYEQPAWLNGDRGDDVSPYLSWYPLITFLQVAFDLPMATSVPLGHGHNYAPNSYIDAWVAVTAPEAWSEEKTRSLKERFADRKPPSM